MLPQSPTESSYAAWKLFIVPEHIDEVLVLSKLPPYSWLLMCGYTLPEICLKALAWKYHIYAVGVPLKSLILSV